ncbi:MAG: YidC/Oxa1 family insertase periplasmic-domain containing protein [Phycisphaerales bacterium]|nr:YidC/Oxa1 family insertase periplasmic-domain containing protein [Phycisphaerales bacterium]
MTPRVRRIAIPLIVLGAAIGVFVSVILHRPTPTTPATGAASASAAAKGDAGGAERVAGGGAGDESSAAPDSGTAADGSGPAASPTGTNDGAVAGAAPDQPQIGAAPGPEPLAAGPSAEEVASWKAFPVADGALGDIPPLGSFDPDTDRMQLEFSPVGAGISRIAFSDFWETAAAKRQAQRYARARSTGASGASLPPEALRYVLQNSTPLGDYTVPVLAAHSIEVNGQRVQVFSSAWACVGPGRFASEIRDGEGRPVLRLTREFVLGANSYDITIRQSIDNLGDAPLDVRWIQYGPGDLPVDRARYIDIRRFHAGYLEPPARDPSQSLVLADGQMLDRTAVIKAVERGAPELWPNAASKQGNLSLAWFGTTNRYFALAIHPAWSGSGPIPLQLGSSVESISAVVGPQPGGDKHVFATLFGPAKRVAPGGQASFDLGVYAGPLDPKILDGKEPYKSLRLSGLILYLMSGCCTFCTFAWLADLMLAFLSFLHDYIVFDWGLAIITLVLIVRSMLHPIMKRSQVQMQRVTRAMGQLKPEMEKLQARYKDDPRKLQQEQMRLYREKGVNPVGCLTGFVPTLLQTPIWIALYAMLYFAFELRQQPAFFGVFQLFGGWSFLADLSSPDHFFWEFAEPRKFLLWNLTGVNLLPILMGIVFFVQQKYMTPPPATPLSPEQAQQQKIMKVMMVVLFPVMLYTAPSGLTLYILTSSLIGIVEGRQIRKHIEETANNPPPPKKKKQDRLGRMYEEALKRAQQRAEEKRQPKRKYKER